MCHPVWMLVLLAVCFLVVVLFILGDRTLAKKDVCWGCVWGYSVLLTVLWCLLFVFVVCGWCVVGGCASLPYLTKYVVCVGLGWGELCIILYEVENDIVL